MQAVREMFYGLRRPRQLNEGKLHDQRVRGERAEALLRDEVFIEALKSIEETYMTAWRKSEGLDVDRRERAHVAVCLLDDIRNQILSYVRDGAVAREQLEKSLHR
jgi:hypothetical protein